MTARMIDGRATAAQIRQELAREIGELAAAGCVPGLAVVMVGDYPPSQMYVKMKEKAAGEIGMYSRGIFLPTETSQEELNQVVRELNQDPAIDGILVQMPLPGHLDEKEVLEIIDLSKDVDCFHPYNVGRLLIGEPGVKPCTPKGCMTLLEQSGVNLNGARAVVIGRSNIVGKPVSVMLLQQNATVTICHSRTQDLKSVVRQADVVVVAVGQTRMITGDYLKPGCVVIDVGQNRGEDGKMIGDVDFDSAAQVAGWITPVPGGVGPMTIAMLLQNTVEAARNRLALKGSG